MPENAFDHAWHSPPRSRGERARGTRPRWRCAPGSLQVPSRAAAILLCCAGCCGAARGAWAEPDEVTPLSEAVGGGVRRGFPPPQLLAREGAGCCGPEPSKVCEACIGRGFLRPPVLSPAPVTKAKRQTPRAGARTRSLAAGSEDDLKDQRNAVAKLPNFRCWASGIELACLEARSSFRDLFLRRILFFRDQ